MIARVLVVVLAVAAPLEAQAPAPAPESAPIARWEIPATMAGMATALAASALLNPANCRWCETTASGSDGVNGLDRSARRALRWSDTNLGTARTLSDLTVYAPLALALIDRGLDRRGVLTVVEALTTVSLVTQAVKYAAARERPWYHYRPPGNASQRKGRNASFFSGHTAEAFTLLVATARVAAARGRPTTWLWIAGAPLAAATGYFRIAGDEHYLTDVLAGAGAGIAVGYLVPALQRAHSAKVPALVPAAFGAGAQVTATWRW